MKIRLSVLAGLAALLIGGEAVAGSCNVQVTGPKGEWKFVHIYDVATGELVLSHAIKAGDTRSVTVSGETIRVDWKLPGYASYRTGTVMPCKDGNTITT